MKQDMIAKHFIDTTPEELAEIERYCKDMNAVQLVRFAAEYGNQRKSPEKAKTLVWILGFAGAHRFYLKQTAVGIVYLLTLGGLGFLSFIDIFRINKLVLDSNLQTARKIYDAMLPEIIENTFKKEQEDRATQNNEVDTSAPAKGYPIFFEPSEQSRSLAEKEPPEQKPIPLEESKTVSKPAEHPGASSPFQLPPDW